MTMNMYEMWKAMSQLLWSVTMFPSQADPTDLWATLAVADAYLEAARMVKHDG